MIYQFVTLKRALYYREQGWWRDETIADLVDKWAEERPNHVVIIDRRRRLTFSQLKDLSERVATGLCRMGLQPGDMLGIQLPNWVEFAIAAVAACRAGLMFTQVGPDLREREIRFMLGYTDAKAVIIPATFKNHDYVAMYRGLEQELPDLNSLIAVGETTHDGATAFSHLESTPVDKDLLDTRRPTSGEALMRVLFTSGTTGDPKGAIHTYDTTIAVTRLCHRGLMMGPDTVLMVVLPMGLNWGFMNLVEVLFTGSTGVLVDQFNAEAILRVIEEEKVTHFCTAPTGLINLLNSPEFNRYDLSSLRLIVSGGASCPVEVIRHVIARFPGKFLELYGMLETGHQTYTRPWQDPVAMAGSVGPCVEGIDLRILDDDGKDVPMGEVGEIAARGPTIVPGYLKNPEANKRSFTNDGWFLTGDLARIDEEGNLSIVDRKKELIIRGGANIYPREIEEVLYTHPRILKAAVVGIPDPRLGERTCACLVTRDGEPLTLDEVTRLLEGTIAKYKWPERVDLFTDLPLTITGKVQKVALRQLVLQRLQNS